MNHVISATLANRIFMLGIACASIVCTATVSGQTREPIQGRVILKSGGTLEGRVGEEKNQSNGRVYVTVEKSDGSLIRLDSSRLVRKVEWVNGKDFEYRQLASKVSSVEDHQSILNWCLEQPSGRRFFKSEIETHAHHVLSALPNDKQARKALGFVFEGEAWIQKDQFYGEHGYTREGTSWTPVRAVQMQGRQETVDEKVDERKDSLRRWLRAARRDETNPDELGPALAKFCDQYALALVEAAAKKEKQPHIRAIMVEGISAVDGASAMRKLVGFAMDDPDEFVRERAVTLLGQPHYDADAASLAFAEFFVSKQNAVIQRAADAIGELGGAAAVVELIDVLVTTHKEKNPNALESGRLNPSFRSDGTSGLQTGGGPQTITKTRQNDSVLNALKVITEQDFGFDMEQWRDWNIKSNTHHDVNVRSD